jgi:hypothetical protein
MKINQATVLSALLSFSLCFTVMGMDSQGDLEYKNILKGKSQKNTITNIDGNVVNEDDPLNSESVMATQYLQGNKGKNTDPLATTTANKLIAEDEEIHELRVGDSEHELISAPTEDVLDSIDLASETAQAHNIN